MQRYPSLPVFLLSSLFGLAALGACADDPVASDTHPGTLKSDSAAQLSSAAPCSYDMPCADGSDCLWIEAANTETALCIGVDEACALLDCGDDECLILESYPAQVLCGGGSSSGDDDDCSVSSDGTTSCP